MAYSLNARDQRILVRFFVSEYDNDPIGVAEWLDNEDYFETEEERDSFIELVRKASHDKRK